MYGNSAFLLRAVWCLLGSSLLRMSLLLRARVLLSELLLLPEVLLLDMLLRGSWLDLHYRRRFLAGCRIQRRFG
ncbi:hypothetical protein MRB53_010343 [Persea americana]|uniref:Uncharacterized protein n=1 Tax=Persea americana TaxID=3435 RepID=A0ACC2LRP0_PERAE|nr:hypothetical protein MRB53_010343 [Persea americana]